ncbi:hypothetical protein P8452_49093 [Trifolium repens]|nr:hypothetical protein P8452_49093 [Trifolium repens]
MCDDQQETINSNKAKIIYIDMVRVLESDRNVVVARLKIHIGEFEERVKNYLATISEFKEENCKLADEKLKIEISYKSLCTKHRKLQERVSKLMEDTELLMSIDATSKFVKSLVFSINFDTLSCSFLCFVHKDLYDISIFGFSYANLQFSSLNSLIVAK